MKDLSAIITRIEKLEERIIEQKVLLTFKQACQYLGFSEDHLYRLCYTGAIPCHNPTGRTLFFFKHELDRWIQEKAVRRRHKK